VDKNRFQTRRGYDSESGYYEYKVYYHSYHKYTSETCELYNVGEVPVWWKNCSMVQTAACKSGDTDTRPTPYEYWE